MIVLDEIIDSIESTNKRMAKVFQLKYFLGLTTEEISEILSISKRSVSRDWLTVRAVIKDILR